MKMREVVAELSKTLRGEEIAAKLGLPRRTIARARVWLKRRGLLPKKLNQFKPVGRLGNICHPEFDHDKAGIPRYKTDWYHRRNARRKSLSALSQLK